MSRLKRSEAQLSGIGAWMLGIIIIIIIIIINYYTLQFRRPLGSYGRRSMQVIINEDWAGTEQFTF